NFRDSSKDGPKPVAILQHGLLDSSYTWVNNYEYQSLGYILADNGFDVWFGNNRGNRYSRNHTTLDPSDGSSAFWEFTWDEMATGDLPAIINYVIDTTGVDSVGYVGHSEGTIQMFAAATSTGENEVLRDALSKVNLFVALAPVTYVSNMGSRLMVALADADVPAKLYDRGDYEFLAYGPIDQIAPKICRVVEKGCDIFLMALCGPTLHVNASRIQVYVSETPAGTSMRNMMHWVQGVEVPTFQKFDWGSSEANMQHYGVGVPPLYDLSKLSVPTALFAGQHDYLGDPTDVQKILDEAPKEKIVYYHMTVRPSVCSD
ncbi:LIPK, partial [Symbiodinium microadriaticum]